MLETLMTLALGFQPDGCTLFKEGTKAEPQIWAHCCLEHDLNYWAGGSRNRRKTVDLELRQCIADTGHPRYALIAYIGVRMGSHSPIKFSKQTWGNAWGPKTQYLPLNELQILQLLDEAAKYDLAEEMLTRLFESLQKDQYNQ